MNANQKIAEDARTLLRGFNAVANLADAFDNVGNLQQAGAEAKAQLDALAPQIADAKNALALAQAATKKERDAAAQVAQAAADADAAARDEAAKTLAGAKREAKDIVAGAAAAASELTAGAQRELEAATATRDALAAEAKDLEKKVADARAYLQGLAA